MVPVIAVITGTFKTLAVALPPRGNASDSRVERNTACRRALVGVGTRLQVQRAAFQDTSIGNGDVADSAGACIGSIEAKSKRDLRQGMLHLKSDG
jgi:hypothetical protein